MNDKQRVRLARDRHDRMHRLMIDAGRVPQLLMDHPSQPRYPSAAQPGSRSTSTTSSVERAIERPDAVTRMTSELWDKQKAACEALEDLERAVHRLAHHAAHTPARVNQVELCAVCAMPAPKPVSHAGQGPLCPACYRSCYDAVRAGTEPVVWRRARMQRLAEAS